MDMSEISCVKMLRFYDNATATYKLHRERERERDFQSPLKEAQENVEPNLANLCSNI